MVSRLTVLAVGQSNMAGFYGPALAPPSHDQVVRAWDWHSAKWVTATLGRRPFRSAIGGGPAHNLAYEAAQQLAAQAKINVDVALFASNNKRVEYFLPNSVLRARGWANNQTDRDFGTSLSDEILGYSGSGRQALDACDCPCFDVVLDHQGEANAGDTAQEFAAKKIAFISELRTRRLIRSDAQIILGCINPSYGAWAVTHANALQLIAANDAHVHVVRWEGVEDVRSITGEDNHHATGKGLAQLGRAYAGLAIDVIFEHQGWRPR